MGYSNVVKILAVALLLSIVFITCNILYTKTIAAFLTEETKSYLVEFAKQTSQLVKSQLEKNLLTLDILSRDPFSAKETPIKEKMKRYKIEVEKFDFLRIGYVDLGGNATTTDNQNFYAGDRDWFMKAASGMPAISEILIDRISPLNPIIVYSTPIYQEKTITAVLFITDSLDKFSNIVNIPFFKEESLFYITDNDGNIIANSKKQENQKNIYKMINDKTHPQEIKNFISSVKKNQSGSSRFIFSHQDRYIGYAPISIAGKSNWNIISSIPVSVISNQSILILKYTFLMTSILSILFLLLIVYILVLKKLNEKKIFHIAFIDKLSGLGNAHKFYIDAETVLRKKSNKKYAVIYFDIDNFKMFNGLYGYTIGNKILIAIANILKQSFQNNAIIGKFPNDFFAILLPYENGKEEIIKILNRLTTDLNNIHINKNINIDLTISIGVYLIQEGESEINKIVNKANMARSAIKRHESTSYNFYNENLKEKLAKEISLVHDIKKAAKEQKFEIYYQPKFSTLDNQMVGSEALIRWNHPEKGIVSPNVFIPVAERNNLIVDISRFVFEKVCNDLNQWQSGGFCALPVSVNLSRIDLYQTDLIRFIENTMNKYHIDARLIEIELTESAALNDLEYTKNIICQLKTIGVKVSMDDFGTGYSSLSCLKEIPIDTLKLDKSFIDDLENDDKSKSIVTSIITLAKSLDLTVVSEGVETKGQANFLKEIGCDIIQGYYFAKPMQKFEIEKLLNITETEPLSIK